MSAPKDSDTLQITNQFRTRRGISYDLRRREEHLTISISPRASEDDLGEWCVEARTGKASSAAVVAEWGATRAEALQAVGSAWGRQAPALPAFDWEAVASLLRTVRAI